MPDAEGPVGPEPLAHRDGEERTAVRGIRSRVGAPPRRQFQRWLEDLDDELVGSALLVNAALPRIARAFLAADRDCIREATSMLADVDQRVAHIEQQGFVVLAREAPVAGDLRRLVSILRLTTSVERSATLLCHVAGTLDRVDPRFFRPDARQLADELARHAAEVFRGGVRAWHSRDGFATGELNDEDGVVDTLARALLDRAGHLTNAAESLALAQLARDWEDIADHGVSFAQHSSFAVIGERVEAGV